MDEIGSEVHRERARRARRLSEEARELAGGERAAAERSERLMRDTGNAVLAQTHRRSAALHREALEHYEEAARLQQVHAEHEYRAAERAAAIERAGDDPRVQETAADQRDADADDRQRLADSRDEMADQRDRHANARELHQDEREGLQDDRERQFDDATGRHCLREQRPALARANAALRRVGERLARNDAALDRDDVRAARDQASIDRESASSRWHTPTPEEPLTDVPGEQSADEKR